MNQECAMPEPSQEHEMIVKNAGVWDVKCRFFMGPDQPPLESEGVDTISAIGQFWTVGRFEADFMGMPFAGSGQLGYLPKEGCFISTWIDSMSTFMFTLKGQYDEATKTLDLKGEGPNPADGELIPQRVEHEFVDDNHHKLRMYMTTEHGEVKSFEMDYTRRI